MSDPCELGGFRHLCMGLSGGCHEPNQSVSYSLLHWIARRTVERHVVDDRADHHPTTHELLNSLSDIVIISTKAIHPSNDEDIPRPEYVEEAPSLRSFMQAGLHSGNTVVGNHAVEFETCCLGLLLLMLNSLIDGGDAGVKDSLHGLRKCPLR